MSIPIQCPKCRANLKAPAAAAGHHLPCPKCKTLIAVTAAPAHPAFKFELDTSNPIHQEAWSAWYRGKLWIATRNAMNGLWASPLIGMMIGGYLWWRDLGVAEGEKRDLIRAELWTRLINWGFWFFILAIVAAAFSFWECFKHPERVHEEGTEPPII